MFETYQRPWFSWHDDQVLVLILLCKLYDYNIDTTCHGDNLSRHEQVKPVVVKVVATGVVVPVLSRDWIPTVHHSQ
jgi:hypothetical protein